MECKISLCRFFMSKIGKYFGFPIISNLPGDAHNTQKNEVRQTCIGV